MTYHYNKSYSTSFMNHLINSSSIIREKTLEKFNAAYTNVQHRPVFETAYKDHHIKAVTTELGINIDSLYLIYQMEELWK